MAFALLLFVLLSGHHHPRCNGYILIESFVFLFLNAIWSYYWDSFVAVDAVMVACACGLVRHLVLWLRLRCSACICTDTLVVFELIVVRKFSDILSHQCALHANSVRHSDTLKVHVSIWSLAIRPHDAAVRACVGKFGMCKADVKTKARIAWKKRNVTKYTSFVDCCSMPPMPLERCRTRKRNNVKEAKETQTTTRGLMCQNIWHIWSNNRLRRHYQVMSYDLLDERF